MTRSSTRSISLIILCALLVWSVGFVGCNDFLTKDVTLGSKGTGSGGGGAVEGDDDADGLSNEVEEEFEMDPMKADSDHDGYSDGLEFVPTTGTVASDPLNQAVVPTPASRARRLLLEDQVRDLIDSDGDGLGDIFEESVGLDPNNPDTDGDGYADGLELVAGSNPFLASSVPQRESPPASDGVIRTGTSAPVDTDRDGLSDEREQALGTNPNKSDSDDDGFSDGLEFLMGSDPLDPRSIPNFNVPAPPTEETENNDDQDTESETEFEETVEDDKGVLEMPDLEEGLRFLRRIKRV